MGARRLVTGVLFVIGAGAVSALLSACDPTPVRTIVVTTLADGRDAAPGNGVCEVTPGQGDCSLRAAIDEANVTAVRVDITVPPGTYALTLTGTFDDDANAVGDLDLDSPSPSVGMHSTPAGATIDASIDGTGDRVDGALDVRGGHVGVAFISTTGGDAGLRAGGTSSFTAFGGSSANHVLGAAVEPNATFRSSYQTFTGNEAYGIGSDGTVTVDHDLIADNSSGIFLSRGSAEVTHSIVRDNVSGELATGGIVAGGLATSEEVDLSIIASTITGNRSGVGGGVVFDYGTLSIVDSTIVDNSGAISGAGVLVGPATNIGGLPLPTATIVRSVITSGAAPAPALSVFRGTVTVSGSILQGNGDDCTADGSSGGVLLTGGYNLTTDSTCPFAASGDLVVADPLLGPLGDNGGLVPTRLPDAASPAVDAIPYGIAGLCDAATPPDQRGVTRPSGSACDIGPVERTST